VPWGSDVGRKAAKLDYYKAMDWRGFLIGTLELGTE